MNESKVHSQGNVAFSWENKPGVRKETIQQRNQQHYFPQKSPPPPRPPCIRETALTTSTHGIKIPPPPGALHSVSRSPRRGPDPFLAAYKECTKSSTSKVKFGSGLKKGLFNFSCKESCRVRNDGFVRISKLVLQKDG